MKYRIYKFCSGDIELIIGKDKIMLTDNYPMLEVDEDTYFDSMENIEGYITSQLLIVQQVEDEVVEVIKEEPKQLAKQELNKKK